MPEVTGLFRWLDWSSVDYSAVTTFIPALGFWCMTAAIVKLMRGKRQNVQDFPFFKGSDQLNVALGLFGTLWGIIVIGYFDLKTVSMGDLMMCLHTALFSTLMAVVWVFMIDRPLVRPFFARLLESCGLSETGDDDLSDAVDRLVVRLGAASDEFDKRQRMFEESSARRHRIFEEDFERRLKLYEDAFEKRHGIYAETFERTLRHFESSFARRVESAEALFAERCRKYEAEFEKRLRAYEQDFDRRQNEYSEFFKRRIDELEKRALEEKVRADAAAAKLAAVTIAIK